MTKHQQLILTIIQNSPEHLTAEKIYLLAKQLSPKISMGTVYRCLGLLVQEGRIRKIPVFGKTDYYDKNCEKHDHLLCIQCGNIRDEMCIRDSINSVCFGNLISTHMPKAILYAWKGTTSFTASCNGIA